jgi:hypothetical protein
MRLPLFAALTTSVAALGLLSACSSRSDVSLTGNAPAQYSHVWVTAQAVWFNTSATAGPEDSGWAKFPLSTPTTIDLVSDNGGTLGTLATSLRVLPGSYSQVRLIPVPVDPSQPASASAQAAGATYNSEVDYEDSAGNTVRLPLELLNPDQGIGIPTALKVPVGNFGAGLAAGASTTGTNGTNNTAGSAGLFGTSGGTTQTTNTTTTGTTGTTTTTTTASFAINLNGTTDLVPFSFGASSTTSKPLANCPTYGQTGITAGCAGILLSQHAAAYDLSEVGGIQGQLTLTNLTGITGVSGLPDLVVSAEVLSADGSRHELIASTPVHSDGSFLLYPLPTNSSTPAIYDVVIHGAGIATIIIRNVTVTLSSSATTQASTTGSTTTGTTGTTGTTSTTTDTSTTATTATSTYSSIITPTVNAVSLGTLIPRAVTTTYSASVTTVTGAPLPPGSLVSFYETPSGEVPYVIESSPLDPFNQMLASPQVLSTGTIDTGTYSTSGNTITVVSAAPNEGAGKYLVAATAPGYADGDFTVPIAPPTGTGTTVSVAVPTLSIASGGATGSVTAVVTATPGQYSQGQLIVSHDGTVVGTVALDSVLAQGGGNVTAIVPAGTPAALYYLSVRVWNSRNPGGTLVRQSYATAVDLRSNTSGSIPLTIN